jgi:anti-sigma factor RsiW
MDCRKARYFLVTSFDGALDAETQKELGYHLKDCRACRHESFYYRELFSAERQLEEIRPSSDFNEKVIAHIRLREAQAAWPRRAETSSSRRRRFGLVLIPALFAAAAALTFMAVLPSAPDTNREVAQRGTEPVQVQDRALPDGPAVAAEAVPGPRYALGTGVPVRMRAPEGMIKIQVAGTDLPEDAFARQIDEALRSYYRSLPTYRSLERTNYVLPVLDHARSQERIY